jgi:hypothetical protein
MHTRGGRQPLRINLRRERVPKRLQRRQKLVLKPRFCIKRVPWVYQLDEMVKYRPEVFPCDIHERLH